MLVLYLRVLNIYIMISIINNYQTFSFIGKNEIENMQPTYGTGIKCRTTKKYRHIRLLKVKTNTYNQYYYIV